MDEENTKSCPVRVLVDAHLPKRLADYLSDHCVMFEEHTVIEINEEEIQVHY